MSAAIDNTPAQAVTTPSLGPSPDGRALAGLRTLYKAHGLAMHAYLGVANRPAECSGRVGDLLEAEWDRCMQAMQAIAEEAERREPRTREDAEAKAEILIRWGLEADRGWT
jgi:hypothetical protein